MQKRTSQINDFYEIQDCEISNENRYFTRNTTESKIISLFCLIELFFFKKDYQRTLTLAGKVT